MKYKNIFQYFREGFTLANKSLDVFLLSIILMAPSITYSLIRNTNFAIFSSTVWYILIILMLVLSMGFNLSIPIFLLDKKQKKSLDYKKIINITGVNTARMIIPGILLFILFVIFIILAFILFFLLFAIIAGILFHPTQFQIEEFFKNLFSPNKEWYLIIVMLLMIPLSFFEFTPFFFSLERHGLISSVKKSIVASFRNLNFIIVVILFSILIYLINNFIRLDFVGIESLMIIINLYIRLIITASALIYYQKVIKEDKA